MGTAAEGQRTTEMRWSIARLSTETGRVVGGGVLLDQRHVLTCAHVVEAASGDTVSASPSTATRVSVQFPGVTGDRSFSASVVGWSEPDRSDVALLEVDHVPEEALPAVLTEPTETSGHTFAVIGFPPGYGRTGRIAHGTLLHAGLDGRVAMAAHTGPRVVGGFSGCPVWDQDAGGVVGIVVEEDLEAEARTSHYLTVAEARAGLGPAWRRLEPQAPPVDVVVSYLEESSLWGDWCAQVLRRDGLSVRQLPWVPEVQPDLAAELATCGKQAGAVLVVLNDRYLLRAGGRGSWNTAHAAMREAGCDALVTLSYGSHRLEPPAAAAGHLRADQMTDDASALAAALLRLVTTTRPLPPPQPGPPPLPAEQQRLRVQEQTDAVAQSHARSVGRRHSGGGCRVVGDRVSVSFDTFRDRAQQQRELSRLIADPSIGVVSIVGGRGIGKSALAARVLGNLESDDWPEGVSGPPITAIISLSTRAGARDVSLERIVVSCAELAEPEQQKALLSAWTKQAPLAERLDAVRTALASGRTVLLLDNVEDELDETGEASDPELTAFLDMSRSRPGSLTVVITSTIAPRLPAGHGTGHHRLDLRQGLPGRDGAELLRELDHTADLVLRDCDNGQLSHIVTTVYGSPRALQLFAALLQVDATLTPAELCSRLQHAEDPLKQLVTQNYERIDSESRWVLETLAVFGRPVQREAIEEVLRHFVPATRSDLIVDRLRIARLIGYDRTSKRFELHAFDADLIRSYLERDRPADLRALHRQAARWYELLRPATLESLQDADPLLLRFQHLVHAGEAEDAGRLLVELCDFLGDHGYPKRVPSLHAQLGDGVRDPRLRLELCRTLASSYVITGPVQVAAQHLTDWISMAEQEGERSMMASALGLLSDLHRFTGDLDQALAAVERSYPINVELGNVVVQVRDLLRIGLISVAAGNLPRAWWAVEHMSLLTSADPTARQRLLDLRSLANLAGGDAAAALHDARRSAEGHLAADEKYDVPYAHNTMGLAYLALDAPSDALQYFDTAQLEASAVDSTRVAAMCHYNAAWALYELGHIDHARQRAERAADTFVKVHAYGSVTVRDDVAASRHLCEALDAAAARDDEIAARHLLAAATFALRNPDLVPLHVMAAEVVELAHRAGSEGLAHEAEELLRRR